MSAAACFLCALVGIFAGLLTGSAALTTLATWTALVAFGALLPASRPVVVVVRQRSDVDDVRALPTAAPGSYPTEERI